MNRLRSSARVRLNCIGAIVLLCSTACTTQLDPGSADAPTPGDAFVDFFVSSGGPAGHSLAAGEEAALAGGATLGLPRGGPGGIQLGVSEGSLTQRARGAFADEFPDVTLGPVVQITARADGATPDYVILRLPASDPASRIFVAGFIDADTSELAWEPIDTRFDAGTGMATALVGWEQLGPVELPDSATQKQSRAMSASGPMVYTGHVAIGVGGQSFDGEVVFDPQSPTGPVTVAPHEAPIPAYGRIGLRLSRITHAPLDTLAVTSGFGHRAPPADGASTDHEGVDYRAEEGTPVYAAGDGVVRSARCQLNSVDCGRTVAMPPACPNGCITGGYIVVIDHGNGEVTRYMHLMNPSFVQAGDHVTAGQPIAFSGNTGGVVAHLHFEVLKNGAPVNPELIFRERATATLAMAIDNHVQAGTQQQIPITFGEITPENMEQYGAPVEVAGLALGQHTLQFVLIEPRRMLRVLAEVPLIVAQGVLTGSESLVQDITTPIGNEGSFDRGNYRTEFTFTLTAADNGTVEGHGHVSYSLNTHSLRVGSGCPDTTAFASAEWDVSLTGFYARQEDGSINVSFFSTPSAGPRYLFTQNSPGCPEKTFTEELSGQSSPSLSATIVDGVYSSRQDVALDAGETGEYFHRVVMEWRE